MNRRNHTALPAALALVCLALCLAACGGDMSAASLGGNAGAPSSSAPSPVSAAASAPASAPTSDSGSDDPAGSSTPDGSFLNQDLLATIHRPLSALKNSYGEDYSIYMVGDLNGALEYYDPYICFHFDPVGYFNLSGKPENAWDSDPFATDELIILYIEIQEPLDTDDFSVSGQDGLRRLFATDETITYDLLAERLHQTPELVHSPAGAYYPIFPYEVHFEEIPVPGGTYQAAFTLGDWEATVVFVKTQDAYVAMRVTFGDFDYEYPS